MGQFSGIWTCSEFCQNNVTPFVENYKNVKNISKERTMTTKS